MTYIKQTFKDNYTVLSAKHLEHIEDGIVSNELAISKINKDFSDTPLKVIYVGNSFSQNSTEYIYDILTDLGYKNPMICVAYKGGCSLAQHLDGLKNNTQQYQLQQATYGGGRTIIKAENGETYGWSLHDVLVYTDWDYIMLQQMSSASDESETYIDIFEIVNYCRNFCPTAKFGWNMTWEQGSNYYANIVNAVRENVLNNAFFSLIIPNGTVVENAKTSYLDKGYINENGGTGAHLTPASGHPFGTFLASLGTAKGLLREKIDVDNLTFKHLLSDTQFEIVKESVKNAYLRPFEKIDSVYTTNENMKTFSVSVAQEGATVLINDEECASKDVEVGGAVKWEVSLDGYTTRKGTHIMTDDYNLPIDFTEDFTQTFMFKITPTPANATVIINNAETNSIVASDKANIYWTVKAEGYETQTGSYYLRKDCIIPIRLQSLE